MIIMRVEVKGTGSFYSKLAVARQRIGIKVQNGLTAVGRKLLSESKKLVPQDTIALHDSGRSTQVGSLLETLVVVGYGGKDFPPRTEYSRKEGRVVTREPYKYTVYVHEDKTVSHSPGQADFLREPLLTKLEELREAFAQGASSV